jgi:hypothetical protein
MIEGNNAEYVQRAEEFLKKTCQALKDSRMVGLNELSAKWDSYLDRSQGKEIPEAGVQGTEDSGLESHCKRRSV